MEDAERRIVVVNRRNNYGQSRSRVREIGKALDLTDNQCDQVEVFTGTARDFLEGDDLCGTLARLIPKSANAPF